ncbi:MAG: DUF1624 domain-containing protein [Saprospiraceae bacterium]|nr:DUF1624 domain-containing protein [Saprospiraceae bacterium]
MKYRIESIDIVRGIAMILMALDHVRDFLHIEAFTADPLDLQTTTPGLYFTRWITHLCAPIFVFLSGTSIYLQSLRKDRKELAVFLIKRGAWFIIAEWTIIALGWTFNPFFNLFPFQVIWAVGSSMVIMGLLLQANLSYRLILGLGLVLVCGHNLLDIPESAPGFQAGFLWDFLHSGTGAVYPIGGNRFVFLIYAFPVWTGVMMLGYSAGIFFTENYSPEKRRNVLLKLGAFLLLFFAALRATNLYGDPVDWAPQKNLLFSFLSFINVDKYPASLLYLSLTLGLTLLMLAAFESVQNKITGIFKVYGRTAFFYYILHIYLIHIIATCFFFARGHLMTEAIAYAQQLPFLFVVPGEGLSLAGVYGIWIGVVVILYPLCLWYDRYKTNHREKWWLSYL